MDLSINDSSYEWFVLCMHINIVPNTLMTFVVVYFIFKHTPQSMKVYKWFLLNVALCSYFLDFTLNVLLILISLFPIIGGCALGILKFLGPASAIIGWVLYTMFTGMCGISILYALLFRLAAVYSRLEQFTRMKIVIGMMLIEVSIPVIPSLIATWIWPGDRESLDMVRKDYPKMVNFYTTHSCIMFARNLHDLGIYFYSCFFLLAAVTLMYGLALLLILYGLNRIKTEKSARTYKMHRSLITALIIQTAFPSLMIAATDLAFAFALMLQLTSSHCIRF
ncbi:serpentine type 7TM GPCR chemoreceptor srh domain-containing protein [Ditylenchus destructor]|nr:serpentine type 7TM GPCR chemoreceptor srh domain-containing protein [Ditylenchus destructor]